MRVGFIGGGKMGAAVMTDLLRSGTVAREDLCVCEVDGQRRAFLEQEYGIAVSADYATVIERAEVLVLAIKPQGLDELLERIGASIRADQLVISIAAGRRLAYFRERVPDARIVRVMPNLAALISQSMNVFCAGEGVGDADRRAVTDLLSSFGRVLELPEEAFDTVTALSGSGPAFLAHFLQQMIDAAVRLGLTEVDATLLAAQTMYGTGKLLAEGVYTPRVLIESVSSKGGTTVAGLEVLTRAALDEAVFGTLKAAAGRSRELRG